MDNMNPENGAVPMGGQPVQPETKKVGPIVLGLAVVLIVIIVGLIMFASNVKETSESTNEVTDTVAPVTNTSDSPEDIQADLEISTSGLEEQNF